MMESAEKPETVNAHMTSPAAAVLLPDTELLQLPPDVLHRLSQLLTPLEGWRQLMQVIVRPGTCDQLLFSTEHIELVREESRRSGRSETEIVLAEWSTWGRKGERPCFSQLLHVLSVCRLFKAADYISVDVLKMDRVTRPVEGPGASVDTSRAAIDSLVNRLTHTPPPPPPPPSPPVIAVENDQSLTPHTPNTIHPSTPSAPGYLAPGDRVWEERDERAAEKEHEQEDEAVAENGSDKMASQEQSVLHFAYAYICQITDNFDAARRLGDGAFGSVFYAWGDSLGELAVKQICSSAELATLQFRTEVETLSSYSHENLLPLIGFSCDGLHNCIVYKFMTNGSLYDKLSCKTQCVCLSWPARLRVALGTSRALHYLHTHRRRPLVHRDVKSANILLDHQLQPQLGDFGLARQSVWGSCRDGDGGAPVSAVCTQITSTVLGTSAYMAPEAFRGDISVKMDVFSFGVVLLEILTGLPPYDENREGYDLLSHVLDVMLADCECDFTSLSLLPLPPPLPSPSAAAAASSADSQLPRDDVITTTTTTATAAANSDIADVFILHNIVDKLAAPVPIRHVHSLLQLALHCTGPKRRRPHISTALDCLESLCAE